MPNFFFFTKSNGFWTPPTVRPLFSKSGTDPGDPPWDLRFRSGSPFPVGIGNPTIRCRQPHRRATEVQLGRLKYSFLAQTNRLSQKPLKPIIKSIVATTYSFK